jgi:tight adherence protein C
MNPHIAYFAWAQFGGVLFAQSLFEYALPFALFGTFAAGSWLLLDYMATGRTRTDERLDEIRDPSLRRRNEQAAAVKKQNTMTSMLAKASVASKPLQPKNEYEANKLKARLSAAGFRSEHAPGVFLGLKFLGLLIGFAVSGGTMLIMKGMTQKTLLYTLAGAGTCFYLPDIVVWWIGRKRKEGIFLGLPDALDLMVVCVEAGLGLDQAMRKVAEELKESWPIICEELTMCNFQLQMGRARSEVLHELGTRTGVDDLRALAAILIQADKFGSGIAQALRVQSDSMRTRRKQLAEEKAAKTAVKLIFPLVLFIFPGIFVVLVGPAAIQIVNQMFPAMSR